MLIRTFAALAVICFSSAAIAQDAGRPEAAAPAKEKKICRVSTPTGTLMAKRTCRTKSEWAASDARDERNADTFRDNKSTVLRPDGLE